MITSYTGDKIDIIRNALDEWNASTPSEQLDIDARVQDENRVLTDIDGQEVYGKMVIFLSPDIDIQYNDRIRVKERLNETVQNALKQYKILSLQKLHGFDIMGWEVII
jgi:hypothetical protein